VENPVQETGSRAGEWQNMAEVDEINTVFCWKIRAPRIWLCEVRGIFKHRVTIIRSRICGGNGYPRQG
jgi:hypothetical protein